MLHDAERLDNEAALPKTAMAQLLLAQHDLAGAQTEIAAASAIAPEDINVLRVSALILRAQGDSKGALAKIGALLAIRPDDVAGLSIRADMDMSQDKLAEAQTDLDRALKLAPNNVGVVFLDGVLLARQGKLKEADAQLSKASEGFNNIPYGYYLQGVVKYQLGQYQQAAAALTKYNARFPNAVVPRQLLARIDLSKHDYSGAIEDLKPVLDADPTDSVSALLLAQAYLASGQRNDALDLYRRRRRPSRTISPPRPTSRKWKCRSVKSSRGSANSTRSRNRRRALPWRDPRSSFLTCARATFPTLNDRRRRSSIGIHGICLRSPFSEQCGWWRENIRMRRRSSRR